MNCINNEAMNRHFKSSGTKRIPNKSGQAHRDSWTGYESPQRRRYLRSLKDLEQSEQNQPA
ncbi:hypothetical protein SynBIOSE41_01844 [Synechococcus sp. BIOS-E4-1]|nr:hypothetical protein SynBIOSE41_01844 [Synechococcus sp. BIOS-E4-1]